MSGQGSPARGSDTDPTASATLGSLEKGRTVPTIIGPPRRALTVGAVLCLVALVAGMALGQSGFKVTHSIGRTTPTHVEVNGTVVNESRAEAVDISVTVEAVGANGKAVARGISYVAANLRPGSSADFVAKVPVVQGAASYRATVSSFRFIQGLQSP